MKTLALADGDLVVTPFGHKTISGSFKVRQELVCAFLEPLGNDRFHRDWGSLLPEYIGQSITEEMELLVLSEANRVLQNYITVQQREVLSDFSAQRRSRFSTADVVRQVNDIRANVNMDSIVVSVALTTQSGESVTLTSEVAV